MKSPSIDMEATGLSGGMEAGESMLIMSLSFPSRESEETEGDRNEEEEEERTNDLPWRRDSEQEGREVMKKKKKNSNNNENPSDLSVVLPRPSPASEPRRYLTHTPCSSSSPSSSPLSRRSPSSSSLVESRQNGRFSQSTPCLYHPSRSVSTAATGRHNNGEEEEEEEKDSLRDFHSEGNEEDTTICLEKNREKEVIEDRNGEEKEEEDEKDGESVSSSVLSIREEQDDADLVGRNEPCRYGTDDRQEEREGEDHEEEEEIEKTRRGREDFFLEKTRREEYGDVPSSASRHVSSFSSLTHEEKRKEETRHRQLDSVRGEELSVSPFSRRASPVLQARARPASHAEVYVHPKDEDDEEYKDDDEEEEEEDRAIRHSERLEEEEELMMEERMSKNEEKREEMTKNHDRGFLEDVSAKADSSSSSPSHHHCHREHRYSLPSTHDGRHYRQVRDSEETLSSLHLPSSYFSFSAENGAQPQDPSVTFGTARSYSESGKQRVLERKEKERRRQEHEEKEKETKKTDGRPSESGSSPSSSSSSYHEESLSCSSSSLLSPSLSPLSASSSSGSSSSSDLRAEKELSGCIETIASMREEDFFFEACKLIRQERFDYLESIRMMKEDHSHLDLLSSPCDDGMMMKMMSIMTGKGGGGGEEGTTQGGGGRRIDASHGRVGDRVDDGHDDVDDRHLHVDHNNKNTNDANHHRYHHRYHPPLHHRCRPNQFSSFYDTRSKLSHFMDLLSSTQSQFFLTSTSSSSSSSPLSHLLNQSCYSP